MRSALRRGVRACAAAASASALGLSAGCDARGWPDLPPSASASASSSASATAPAVAVAHASAAVSPSTASISQGLLGCIGHTDLVELASLSAATGCHILAKCEHLNPGGSVKDRPSALIIRAFEDEGRLVPRGARAAGDRTTYTIVEATGGNTGLGMALVAAARGYRAIFTMPENVSSEKVELARTLGAEVVVCPLVPFADPRHYYNRAKEIADSTPNAVHGNQFESLANARAHYEGTGPEIWRQAGGRVDGLVLAAGTGGTIGGLSRYLREVNPRLAVFLIDPPGSALANYVETGEMVASAGKTITEGIGIARLTRNFASSAPIDGSFRGTDAEAVSMAYYLLRREGLFVGPSAALNVCGAVKLARRLGPGHTIVTVLCDGGGRYGSKLFSASWLEAQGLIEASHVDAERDHADFVH